MLSLDRTSEIFFGQHTLPGGDIGPDFIDAVAADMDKALKPGGFNNFMDAGETSRERAQLKAEFLVRRACELGLYKHAFAICVLVSTVPLLFQRAFGTHGHEIVRHLGPAVILEHITPDTLTQAAIASANPELSESLAAAQCLSLDAIKAADPILIGPDITAHAPSDVYACRYCSFTVSEMPELCQHAWTHVKTADESSPPELAHELPPEKARPLPTKVSISSMPSTNQAHSCHRPINLLSSLAEYVEICFATEMSAANTCASIARRRTSSSALCATRCCRRSKRFSCTPTHTRQPSPMLLYWINVQAFY